MGSMQCNRRPWVRPDLVSLGIPGLLMLTVSPPLSNYSAIMETTTTLPAPIQQHTTLPTHSALDRGPAHPFDKGLPTIGTVYSCSLSIFVTSMPWALAGTQNMIVVADDTARFIIVTVVFYSHVVAMLVGVCYMRCGKDIDLDDHPLHKMNFHDLPASIKGTHLWGIKALLCLCMSTLAFVVRVAYATCPAVTTVFFATLGCLSSALLLVTFVTNSVCRQTSPPEKLPAQSGVVELKRSDLYPPQDAVLG
ncbi:hypothetical protein BOTBODRAFT_451111 [Botryobasidium botryosum FD-172 SS1]|uniref:Uncharacterized protein n=1 Tax=Botryobasidium botryosum (strain FD-172 SS1) TaxID=930990 RepID=A0A067MIW8_BOTB1|nr:hypothetical protein BOTBODRAFT_451111 [Botryobasidium botryosum FD-172 SS1]